MTGALLEFKEDDMREFMSRYPSEFQNKEIEKAKSAIISISKQFSKPYISVAANLIVEAMKQGNDEVTRIQIAAFVLAAEKLNQPI